jgi:hypothetical protein
MAMSVDVHLQRIRELASQIGVTTHELEFLLQDFTFLEAFKQVYRDRGNFIIDEGLIRLARRLLDKQGGKITKAVDTAPPLRRRHTRIRRDDP